MNIPEEIFSTLTEEQKEKARDAKTPEDFLALVKETGYELSREQLEAVSGSGKWYCDAFGCTDYTCVGETGYCPDNRG